MVFKSIIGATCTCLAVVSFNVNAALVSRLGGLAYYDDVADLTWLTDANAGAGSIYDDLSSTTDGFMTWESASNWVASLNISGVTGWRLPGNTNCGGWNCVESELGNMYYNVLGGKKQVNISTTHNTNYDLFSNIIFEPYWSDEHETDPTRAWRFDMNGGLQSFGSKSLNFSAWAVHSGDVSAVPIPTAIWLFGSGLIGLIGVARRKKA